MHARFPISVTTVFLVLALLLQNVEGLKKIKECEPAKTLQQPLICIDDPEDSGHAAINTSEIYNRLLLLQNETSVHCGNATTHVKFYLYVLKNSTAETYNTSRLIVDDLVLEENVNCSNYGVLFITNNSASITIGANAARLLDETEINADLQSLQNASNIEERVFEAIEVLKSAVANAAATPKEAGGQNWVILVGIGFIALILVAMAYWFMTRNNNRRGMTAVDTDG